MQFRKRFYFNYIFIGAALFGYRVQSAGMFPEQGISFLDKASNYKKISAEFRAGLSQFTGQGAIRLPGWIDPQTHEYAYRRYAPDIALVLRYFLTPTFGFDFGYGTSVRKIFAGTGIPPIIQNQEFEFKIPVKFQWSEGEYFAPFLGYRFETSTSTLEWEYTETQPTSWVKQSHALPVGMQTRVEILGLGILAEAAISLVDKSKIERSYVGLSTSLWQMNAQLEWVPDANSSVWTLYALRYALEYRTLGSNSTSPNQIQKESFHVVTGVRF